MVGMREMEKKVIWFDASCCSKHLPPRGSYLIIVYDDSMPQLRFQLNCPGRNSLVSLLSGYQSSTPASLPTSPSENASRATRASVLSHSLP